LSVFTLTSGRDCDHSHGCTCKIDEAVFTFVSFESTRATGCRVYGSKGVHFALERSFERVCDALFDAFQPLALLCLPICKSYIR
jgi:hypothetical protein